MHTLLLTLLLSGPIGAHGTKPEGAASQRDIHCEQAPAPVVVVVDGTSEWPGRAANRIVGELKLELGSRHPLQVARFDAKPAPQLGFTVKGANRDLVKVRPRTPMREAMAAGFARLISAPNPRTMVVIAHEQLYPTTVSTDGLIELARRSGTKVHTIHLASNRAQGGVPRRLGRSLKNAIVWLVEALVLKERGYSSRDTARLLKAMADATGGKACVAGGERTGSDCAKSVAAEILIRPR